ncbi:hypothetical protein THF1C08_80040 [Vibrio jasicida]|nr:hypothetical protein THF1C08_80040 [Vibrio jasicida]
MFQALKRRKPVDFSTGFLNVGECWACIQGGIWANPFKSLKYEKAR